MIGSQGIIEGRGWDELPELSIQDSLSVGFFTDLLPQSSQLLNSTAAKFLTDGVTIGMMAEPFQIICDVPLCVDLV